MNHLLNLIFVFSATILLVTCAKSPYKQCRGLEFPDLENRINVSSCEQKKCTLIKGTDTTVAFRIKPVKKVTSLMNKVTAKFPGMSLQIPFASVSGTDACGSVYLADTDARASCPLLPGVEYVYKNHFYIYYIYPEALLTVHWELISDDKPIICFEVPARIVPNPNKYNNKLNTTTEASKTVTRSSDDITYTTEIPSSTNDWLS